MLILKPLIKEMYENVLTNGKDAQRSFSVVLLFTFISSKSQEKIKGVRTKVKYD